ncbi:MAG: erythromycin biosynthesis sensory transduction protein eryC1 [Omnitrophica WOR_2 bacterium RBG_13_41_10]|nr:MAG: erythromycin biosynthesis sensory transduction protein eryC1 [Omnitrophica WOR_2 bacterium RBG_13_41_10]
MKIPFLDLSQQIKEAKKDFNAAFNKTVKNYDFILGEEVALFEKEFAQYCHKKFAVGVNSGTDALFLGLLSLRVGPGDEVIVPTFTYIATALAVSYTGAKPVFVDINERTYNIDPGKIKAAITNRTKAIIPVHLYGQPADMQPILKIAKAYNLKAIEDTAQAHGAKYKMPNGKWEIAGSMTDIGAFSFYPTKNLGAFGDGGMCLTDDEGIYKKLLMLRDYGRRSRYEHITLGYNSRLDTIQAAVLRVKLKHLDKWNALRRRNAKIYLRELQGIKGLIFPLEAGYAYHVYHVFAIRVKNRDRVIEELAKKGIRALIHYPIPLHLQEVYKDLGYKKGDFPVAERIAKEILSLPMYPHLKETQIKFITSVLKDIMDK